MRRLTLGRTGDVPAEHGLEVTVEGRVYALFRLGDTFHALGGLCPHRDGPLAAGDVADGFVTCPWHAWRFDIRTGVSPQMPAARVPCHPVTLDGDQITIEVE